MSGIELTITVEQVIDALAAAPLDSNVQVAGLGFLLSESFDRKKLTTFADAAVQLASIAVCTPQTRTSYKPLL